MKPIIPPQEAAFFSRNGYLELSGMPFDRDAVRHSAATALKMQPLGRDLWRSNETLNHLLLKKLAPLVLQIAANPLRLACDQWLLKDAWTNHSLSFKDFFCIQGIALIAIFSPFDLSNAIPNTFGLGVSPFPKSGNNVLFIKPNIVLDWHLSTPPPPALYIAAYAFAHHAVYIYNPKDPATHFLKKFNYAFGDSLQDTSHPMIRPATFY